MTKKAKKIKLKSEALEITMNPSQYVGLLGSCMFAHDFVIKHADDPAVRACVCPCHHQSNWKKS